MDADKSGSVSVDELKQALRKIKGNQASDKALTAMATQIIQSADVDGDGEMSNIYT